MNASCMVRWSISRAQHRHRAAFGSGYAAIDIDASPGSIPLDLNFDDVPAEFKASFALVTNFGTTEHVANQLNAFKTIHDLAEVGGVMIHTVPAQGYMNHGMVNYNPKFFWMLARSNGYKWLYSNFRMSKRPYPVERNIVDEMRPFDRDIDKRFKRYRIFDGGIRIALQKVCNIAYVPPLDVPTGGSAPNETLKERYWTVFAPERLVPS